MNSLPELICAARNIVPPEGDLAGQCVFCGRFTESGRPAAMSPDFTNAPQLSGGDVICPYCQHMQSAEIPGTKQSAGKLYRANMWVASLEGMAVVRFPRKEKEGQAERRDMSAVFTLGEMTPREALLEPPEPPFAIYLTRTWKKSGWQSMVRAGGGVSMSRAVFLCGFDYDPVMVDRKLLAEYLAEIDGLREQKVSKTELSSGQLGIRSLERIHFDENVVRRLRDVASDPLWSLAVYVA